MPKTVPDPPLRPSKPNIKEAEEPHSYVDVLPSEGQKTMTSQRQEPHAVYDNRTAATSGVAERKTAESDEDHKVTTKDEFADPSYVIEDLSDIYIGSHTEY